jgi:hypothetical protein
MLKNSIMSNLIDSVITPTNVEVDLDEYELKDHQSLGFYYLCHLHKVFRSQ